jgi:hypothetical protein
MRGVPRGRVTAGRKSGWVNVAIFPASRHGQRNGRRAPNLFPQFSRFDVLDKSVVRRAVYLLVDDPAHRLSC